MVKDTDLKTQCLNQGEDSQMEITGYRRNLLKTVVVWIFILLTVGLLRLFFYWLPHLMIKAMNDVCSLAEAQCVVLKDQYEQYFVSKVLTIDADGNKVPSKSNGTRPRSLGSQSPLDPAASRMTTETHGESHPMTSQSQQTIRYFMSKKVKYMWNEEFAEFQQAKGYESGVTCTYFHQAQALSYDEQCKKRITYGINSIQIHITPIIKLLFKEVLSPFYIFQVFSCTLWYYDEYEYYASCIVFISCVSIIATIYQTRKMQRALRDTIDSSSIVSVCRGGDEYHDISSDDLVPGDVIEIPRGGCTMQCDAILVAGNCIVNESMLTGESVPVTKTPLPNPKTTHEDSVVYFNIKDHARHVLFCGTRVIQTRYYGGQKVKAVVFRTGFSTAKGELVRSILYPKPVDFKFNKDTYKFVGILAGIAFMGFIYTIVLMVRHGDPAGDIIVRSLDLITIAVPPALPAALTVGIVFAQARLKTAGIYCISPRSINVCGSINTVCFDKTGTLTEDGLDMQCTVPVTNGQFGEEIHNQNLLPKGHFMTGMATCHSLTLIDGVLSGDPLELIMFEAVNWELTEPGPEETSRFDMLCPTIVHPKSARLTTSVDLVSGNKVLSEEVGIIRQFTFSSSLQRMSVVIRSLTADHFDIYTKGAPEMIASLCVTDTIPNNFHETLMNYTRHGYRVIALAYKSLPAKLKYTKLHRIQREQVERGLTFMGLIVMENRLKPETAPIIDTLTYSNIRSVMITGDNMLTALSVARECGMVLDNQKIVLVQAYPPTVDKFGNSSEVPYVEYIDMDSGKDGVHSSSKKVEADLNFDVEVAPNTSYRFAVTGKSWAILREFFPDVVDKIVTRGTVFARMSPEQKAQLVENLQDIGYYVGMCGDGANDCGALKAAHAGISLSEAEASVASPFTSKIANISCIPTTIREGRAALVTSIGIFKYMACYSLTQFVTVLILYWVGMNISDFQFLYIDLALLTSLSVTFGQTGAYHKLSKVPPIISLISLAPILSLVLQMCIMTGFQVFSHFIIRQAPWFVPWVENPEDEYDFKSYDNTAMFYISMYQYVILAVVFSKGRPYRKPIYTNLWFLFNIIACLGINMWLNIYPTDGVTEFMALQPPPNIPYRFIYVGTAFMNFMLCLLLEMFILDSNFVTVTLQKKMEDCFPNSKPKYLEIEKELDGTSTWPPVKAEDLAGTFQRLDSAYQSMSQVNLGSDPDNFSLSGSETDSVKSLEDDSKPNWSATSDDIHLLERSDKEGFTNYAFNSDDGTNKRTSQHMSTKL